MNTKNFLIPLGKEITWLWNSSFHSYSTDYWFFQQKTETEYKFPFLMNDFHTLQFLYLLFQILVKKVPNLNKYQNKLTPTNKVTNKTKPKRKFFNTISEAVFKSWVSRFCLVHWMMKTERTGQKERKRPYRILLVPGICNTVNNLRLLVSIPCSLKSSSRWFIQRSVVFLCPQSHFTYLKPKSPCPLKSALR